jgi:hypothetical protein
MATRTQLRAWLRRRLQETTADQWTDSVLNDYLNEGLHFVQQEIEKIDPEAFMYEDSANIVASQRTYAWPANMKREVKVKVKMTSTATSYTTLERVGIRKVDNPDIGPVSDQVNTYAHYGRYLKLQATPAENVTKGLWLQYIPTLVMGADADVPVIPVDLHMGIVLAAQLTAFGDASGTTDKEQVRQELADVIVRLPLHYVKSGAEPDKIVVSDHYRVEPGDM